MLQEQQRRLEAFKPAYQRLVSVVVSSVQYPANYQELHRDEMQDFRHDRYAFTETLEDAAGQAPAHSARPLAAMYLCCASKELTGI